MQMKRNNLTWMLKKNSIWIRMNSLRLTDEKRQMILIDALMPMDLIALLRLKLPSTDYLMPCYYYNYP
jgi:hypothetical protein